MSWIKMEASLLHDGRVRDLSRKLSRSRHEVVGILFDFWCLADAQAEQDGTLSGWSKGDVDDHVRVQGFADSMPECWLVLDESGSVKLPNYHEHNGSTAKTRALAQKRQRDHRKRVTQSVTRVSRQKRDASYSLSNTLSTEGTRKGVQRETIVCGAEGNVRLTEAECAKLQQRHGESRVLAAIEILDAWIETKPGKLAWFEKKYSSAFSVLNPKTSWVWDRVDAKSPTAKTHTKETNLEKTRRALYGDPKRSSFPDGVLGDGVRSVSSDPRASGDLDGASRAVLAGTTPPRGQTLLASLGLGVWSDATPTSAIDKRLNTETGARLETGSSSAGNQPRIANQSRGRATGPVS